MPRQPLDSSWRTHAEGPYARAAPVPRQPHPSLLEELDMQQHEIHRLLTDNRRLADDRMVFQQELAAVKEEFHRRNMAMTDLRAEKEAHIRELIEKGMKLEADLKALEPLRDDVIQLRAEVKKLNATRQELVGQIQNLMQELTKTRTDNNQIPVMRAEIDNIKQELSRARAAYEYEKKGNAELLEQRQAMEKNMISMAREIEKLRVNFPNTEGRSYTGGAAYGMKMASPDASFPSYGDGYGMYSGISEKGPSYGAPSGSWAPPEKFRPERR